MLKKLLTTATLLLLALASAAPGKGNLWLTKGETKHRLVVKFKPELGITARGGALSTPFRADSDLGRLINHKKLSFNRLLPESMGLDSLEMRARENLRQRGEQDLSHLGFASMLIVQAADESNEALLSLAQQLEQLPEVQYCELQATTFNPQQEQPSEFLNPEISPFAVTPSYEDKQTYLGANPGMNVRAAWDAGFTGKGVRIADIEYDWNFDHEAFRGRNIHVAKGLTIGKHSFTKDHGTCVLGIMLDKRDGVGMTGIAYDCSEMICFPEMTVEAPSSYNRPYTLGVALSQLKPGDIFLYEIQLYGPNNNQYVPAEYDKAVWDLTKAAVDAGIVVVATGSNGDQNMDDPMYAEYMNRGSSGALMVGAGVADINHNRISKQQYSWGSTYGSRFDVQAWGEKTATTGSWGSGSVKVDNDPNRDYCTSFGGTSGAGPQVAGVVALLQQAAKERLGKVLNTQDVRSLLVSTGYPQGTQIPGKIGPFVNAKAALEKLLSSAPLSASYRGYTDASQNSILEPSEQGTVEVEVFNNGSQDLSTINATLSSSSALVTINAAQKSLSSLAPQSSARLSFAVTAKSFSGTQKVPFKVALSGGGNYTIADTLILGARPKYLLPFNRFTEAEPLNNGSLSGMLIVNLENTSFKNVGNFTHPEVKIPNLPTGLVPRLEVIDSKTARLYLDGKATNHAAANKVSNLKLDLAALLTNSSNLDNSEGIDLLYIDPYTVVTYNGITNVKINSGTTFSHRYMDNKNYLGQVALWYYQGKLKFETYGGGVICNSGTRNVTLLNANVDINAKSNFTPYMSNQNIVDVASSSYNAWFGKQGYIGFQFKLGNFMRQAWAKVQVDAAGGEMSLLEYAYNENPLGGILTGTTTSGIELKPELMKELVALDDNYPNPFNPTTTINFSLKKPSEVKLAVYNLRGELVRELVNGSLPAGAQAVKFNGASLNSGVYFYRLTTPEQSITKKMMLVK